MLNCDCDESDANKFTITDLNSLLNNTQWEFKQILTLYTSKKFE